MSVGLDCSLTAIHFFFFQAEDGIRDKLVTGVQTCALPIWADAGREPVDAREEPGGVRELDQEFRRAAQLRVGWQRQRRGIGRASCRERGEISVVAVSLKKKKRK